MPSSTPSKLGRYEIQALLGKGSMGVVYLARDPLIGRLVALKTFRPNLSGDDDEMERFRQRFLREAQSAGILSHPNIVTVHDVVEESEEGATFIAMEYVQGTNLKEVLRYGKPLELAEIVEVMRQVGSALDYAHDHKVVHRDVKPANVLLTPEPDRSVKLTDFGIARFDTSNLTHDGQLLGTPNYMSPEQVQGRDVDHRTDLFSLGVILYEMVTRHKPFAGENLTVVTHRIVYDDYTPIERYVGGMPPGLKGILDRALAKDPDRRYRRASEMADDLAQVVGVHEEQVSLSETQSIQGLSVAPPAEQGEDTVAASTAATIPGGVPVPPMVGSGEGSGSGSGEALGSMVAAGAGARPPSPAAEAPQGGGGVNWARLAAIGGALAVLLLVAGLLFARWAGPAGDDPTEYDAAYVLDRQFEEAVREGQRANRDGQPEAAAAAFRRAQSLKPDHPQVGRWLRVAEQQERMAQREEVLGEQVAAAIERAEVAMAEGRYEAAVEAAQLALELDPDSEAASALEVRAAAAEARQRQRRAAEQRAAAEPEPEAVPTAEPAASEPEATGPALLSVRLETEGQGRFFLYGGSTLLADVGYDFTEKAGLFSRRRPVRGTKSLDDIQLEPVSWDLRFRLEPRGGTTKTGTVTGEFKPGEHRTLVVVYTANAGASARLE